MYVVRQRSNRPVREQRRAGRARAPCALLACALLVASPAWAQGEIDDYPTEPYETEDAYEADGASGGPWLGLGSAGLTLLYFPVKLAYADQVKIDILGVTEALIRLHGAVSEETARAMAEGVRRRFGTEYGLAITGVAGPAGGSPDKPVGTVFLAVADAVGGAASRRSFGGNRDAVRRWAVAGALHLLRVRLEKCGDGG